MVSLKTPAVSALACPAPSPIAGSGVWNDDAAKVRLQHYKARSRRTGEASFFWYDAQFQKIAVKVLPGEYAAHGEDVMIATVLGSCVSCCLWDGDARVGGMNHFMLPEGSPDSGGRYGAFAMELLVNEVLKLGASRRALRAKIFGGGRVLGAMNSFDVGDRNTRFALNYLEIEGIPLLGQDVLGPHPRKVVFFPRSGEARVKKLAADELVHVTVQERAATERSMASTRGTVELF